MAKKLSAEERAQRRCASRARWREKRRPGSVGRPRGRRPLDAQERARRRRIATRKASLKWYRKNSHHIADRKHRDARRPIKPEFLERNSGLSIVSSRGALERPPLRWIDHNGKVHREDRRSAEELIAEYLRKEGKP